MQLKIKKLHPDARLPVFATAGAACFDLYALRVEGAFTLGANCEDGHPITCGTGLAFEIPEGYVMLIFSRSGHGFNQGLRLANCVGVIDSDYRGEVNVKLTKDYHWRDDEAVPPMICPGDRIAQLVFMPVVQAQFELVEEFDTSERGEGGFGHSGRS